VRRGAAERHRSAQHGPHYPFLEEAGAKVDGDETPGSDDDHSSVLRRATRSLNAGEAGVRHALHQTIENRPKRERGCRFPARSLGSESSRQGRLGCLPQARSTTTMTKIATDIKTCPRPVRLLCHQRLRSVPRSWHAAGRAVSHGAPRLEKETTRSLRDGQSRCRRLRSYSQAPRAARIMITPPTISTTLPCAVARIAKPSTPSEVTRNDAHHFSSLSRQEYR
jgi:hypothetical protein